MKSEAQNVMTNPNQYNRRTSDAKNTLVAAQHKVQESRQSEPTASPPTFLKGISSHINFRDTKQSANNNYINENNYLELQEVQEKTIFEEENEQILSATGPSRASNTQSKVARPLEEYKSKNLSKKQQTLVKQTQYIYGQNQPNQNH